MDLLVFINAERNEKRELERKEDHVLLLGLSNWKHTCNSESVSTIRNIHFKKKKIFLLLIFVCV
jgi:hypothetical protein